MSTPSELLRRLSRRIEQHKPIRLSPEELDILVISGAFAKFAEFVAEDLKQQVMKRHLTKD